MSLPPFVTFRFMDHTAEDDWSSFDKLNTPHELSASGYLVADSKTHVVVAPIAYEEGWDDYVDGKENEHKGEATANTWAVIKSTIVKGSYLEYRIDDGELTVVRTTPHRNGRPPSKL